jgi:hypothetical protein
MTQRLVAPPLDFGGTPSMCAVVSNREKPMDTTASSFTARNNAKRAAEAMIRKGTAPAVDYAIKPSDDGRFEIVWKSTKTAPTTDEVETEIAEAPANQPAAASPTEDASQHAPAATERATTDAAPRPASEYCRSNL